MKTSANPNTPGLQTACNSAKVTVSAENRTVVCQIDMRCSAEALFAVWADVANWHTWDPDTQWARLDGPFATASVGRIKPPKGMSIKMVVTQVTPARSFTVVCPVLGSHMHFEHTLSPLATPEQGVRVTHTVRFTGWLSRLLMRTIGRQVASGLPLTLTRLRAVCESKMSAR